jgi:hypothetical protein
LRPLDYSPPPDEPPPLPEWAIVVFIMALCGAVYLIAIFI